MITITVLGAAGLVLVAGGLPRIIGQCLQSIFSLFERRP
jgi:hypothetical protein